MTLKNILTLILISFLSASYAQKKPNIIYILADDLGYADLACFGSKRIKTPNLDQMAAEGMTLTRFYSTGVCAPSRAALMTGKHLGHCEIRGNRQNTPKFGQMPLSDSAQTIAMLLKNAGYSTALIGKWGIGEPGTSGDPNKKGFDLAYGYTDQVSAHNHWPEYLLRNGKKELLRNKVTYTKPDGWDLGRGSVSQEKVDYSQDFFTKEALDFMTKNKKKPFFLYFTPVIPHDNGEAPKGQMIESPTMEPYTNEVGWSDDDKRYAASITLLDREVGKLLAHLKKLNIDERTLVVFMSDNGPKQLDAFESAGTLRGIKRDPYEGGVRVPFIARWPNKIKAGTTSQQPAALWDLLPTACEVAGIQQPKVDGESLKALLLDSQSLKRKHLYFELHDGGNKQALIDGRWKGVRKGIKPGQSMPKLELYDLEKDPSEQHDVADVFPEICTEIESKMKQEHVPSKVFSLPGDEDDK
jgi:arylsulfatase A